ncbi:hypothetical protein D3C86_2031970 [compost metagenome]
MLPGGKIPCKAVASIVDRTHCAALHQVRADTGLLELVGLATALQMGNSLEKIIAIQVSQHVVAEQRTIANRIRFGCVRLRKQAGKILSR